MDNANTSDAKSWMRELGDDVKDWMQRGRGGPLTRRSASRDVQQSVADKVERAQENNEEEEEEETADDRGYIESIKETIGDVYTKFCNAMTGKSAAKDIDSKD